jgi:hypothetical protein
MSSPCEAQQFDHAEHGLGDRLDDRYADFASQRDC